MKLNKNKFDDIQLGYLNQAEKLQAELINIGFMASRIEKGEDRTDFQVIYFDGVRDYLIRRGYDGNIYAHRKEYAHYPNVSSSTRGEVYAKYKGDNMKVLTAKKLQAKLDAENASESELEAKEKEAQDKINAFLKSIDGLGFKFSREDYKDEKSPIKSGELVKNGVEFEFTISQDGYISKKIKIHYAVDNTLENFLKLSDNKL